MLLPLRHEWLEVTSFRIRRALSLPWDQTPRPHDDIDKVRRLTGDPGYSISGEGSGVLYDWLYYYRDALRFSHGVDLWEMCRFNQT